jgi:Mn2+/Fe2+ NRAMP family transporter
MKKIKSYSRGRKEVTICVLMIIIPLILFIIFPGKLFYNLFAVSMLGSVAFLYFTFIKDFYYEIKKKKLKTKAELIIRIIYLIMFGMVVALFIYSIILIVGNFKIDQ